MIRPIVIVLIFSAIAVAQPSKQLGQGTPTLQLVTKKIFKDAYQGCWGIPKPGDGTGYERFGLSAGGHCWLDNGNCLMRSHDLGKYIVREVTPPAVLSKTAATPSDPPLGTAVGPWITVPTPPLGPTTYDSLHSFIHVGNNIFQCTVEKSYNTSTPHETSQFQWDRTGGTVTDATRLDDPLAYHNSAAGYVLAPPPGITCTHLCGLCGSSGTQTTSMGPCLIKVTYDSMATQQPSKVLCHYPWSAEGTDHHPDFDDLTARIQGAAWIETPRHKGVVFIARVGKPETYWYGHQVLRESDPGDYYDGTDPFDPNRLYYDPISTSKGVHSEEYGYKMFVADPDHIREVDADTRDPKNVPFTVYDCSDLFPHRLHDRLVVRMSQQGDFVWCAIHDSMVISGSEKTPILYKFGPF